MGIIITRKEDNSILMKTNIIENKEKFFTDFLLGVGGTENEYSMIETEDGRIFTHKTSVIDGQIVLGESISSEPGDTTNTEIEEIKMYLATSTSKYNSLDKASTPLEELKKARIEKLKEECTNSIYNGFESQGFTFGFNENDQANFTQQLILVVAGQTESIPWKTKNANVQLFTPQQFKQIVTDAKNHKLVNQEKYWSLEAEVHVVFTNEEVDAIRW